MRQSIRTEKSTNIWKARKDKTDHPCIWMQAGIAKKKNCNNFYDCTNCKYDDSMAKTAKAGKHITWQEALRNRDSKDRTCRHALTHRTEHKSCPMNYNCGRCDFDQYFEDILSPKTGHSMVYMKDVKGFDIADGYYFHKGHTWASIDSGGLIRIGLDDFLFKVLGCPDAFDLPLTGQELNKDKAGWGLKRKENLADILSPVNGIITEVNNNTRKSPDLSKNDPYGDGWLFTIHNSDIKGIVQDLKTDNDSVEWLGQEVTTLENMIERVTGPLSADGGLLKADVFGNLPTLGWHNLTRTFFRT